MVADVESAQASVPATCCLPSDLESRMVPLGSLKDDDPKTPAFALRILASIHVVFFILSAALQIDIALTYCAANPGDARFGIIIGIVFASHLLINIMSLFWIYARMDVENGRRFGETICVACHVFLAGPIWRYFKLMITRDIKDFVEFNRLRTIQSTIQDGVFILIQVAVMIDDAAVRWSFSENWIPPLAVCIAFCSMCFCYCGLDYTRKIVAIEKAKSVNKNLQDVNKYPRCEACCSSHVTASLFGSLTTVLLLSSRCIAMAIFLQGFHVWTVMLLVGHSAAFTTVKYFKHDCSRAKDQITGKHLVLWASQVLDWVDPMEEGCKWDLTLFYGMVAAENFLAAIVWILYVGSETTNCIISGAVIIMFVFGLACKLITERLVLLRSKYITSHMATRTCTGEVSVESVYATLTHLPIDVIQNSHTYVVCDQTIPRIIKSPSKFSISSGTTSTCNDPGNHHEKSRDSPTHDSGYLSSEMELPRSNDTSKLSVLSVMRLQSSNVGDNFYPNTSTPMKSCGVKKASRFGHDVFFDEIPHFQQVPELCPVHCICPKMPTSNKKPTKTPMKTNIYENISELMSYVGEPHATFGDKSVVDFLKEKCRECEIQWDNEACISSVSSYCTEVTNRGNAQTSANCESCVHFGKTNPHRNSQRLQLHELSSSTSSSDGTSEDYFKIMDAIYGSNVTKMWPPQDIQLIENLDSLPAKTHSVHEHVVDWLEQSQPDIQASLDAADDRGICNGHVDNTSDCVISNKTPKRVLREGPISGNKLRDSGKVHTKIARRILWSGDSSI